MGKFFVFFIYFKLQNWKIREIYILTGEKPTEVQLHWLKSDQFPFTNQLQLDSDRDQKSGLKPPLSQISQPVKK